jgi:hypothetical protein
MNPDLPEPLLHRPDRRFLSLEFYGVVDRPSGRKRIPRSGSLGVTSTGVNPNLSKALFRLLFNRL